MYEILFMFHPITSQQSHLINYCLSGTCEGEYKDCSKGKIGAWSRWLLGLCLGQNYGMFSVLALALFSQ